MEALLNETGTSTALLSVALGVIVLVIADLVRVMGENNSDTGSAWEKKITSCRDRIAKAVPLTSIKIVVIAWQIVTQVNESGVGQYVGYSFSIEGSPPYVLFSYVFEDPSALGLVVFFSPKW